MPFADIFRYSVLLFGIGIMGIVIAANYAGPALLVGQLLFGLWNILPQVLFFVVGRIFRPFYFLISAGILISLIHLYFVWGYFHSASSTSALIFIFLPVYEILPLGILFLMAYGFEIFKKGRDNPPDFPLK